MTNVIEKDGLRAEIVWMKPLVKQQNFDISITGPAGCGKTLLREELAGRLNQRPVVRLLSGYDETVGGEAICGAIEDVGHRGFVELELYRAVHRVRKGLEEKK